MGAVDSAANLATAASAEAMNDLGAECTGSSVSSLVNDCKGSCSEASLAVSSLNPKELIQNIM